MVYLDVAHSPCSSKGVKMYVIRKVGRKGKCHCSAHEPGTAGCFTSVISLNPHSDLVEESYSCHVFQVKRSFDHFP